MLPGLREQIWIIKKLKKINMALLKLLDSMTDKPSFFLIKKKIDKSVKNPIIYLVLNI